MKKTNQFGWIPVATVHVFLACVTMALAGFALGVVNPPGGSACNQGHNLLCPPDCTKETVSPAPYTCCNNVGSGCCSRVYNGGNSGCAEVRCVGNGDCTVNEPELDWAVGTFLDGYQCYTDGICRP